MRLLALSFFSLAALCAQDSLPPTVATTAETELRRVLDLDPDNPEALRSMASLKYQQAQGMPEGEQKTRKLDEASEWYRKLVNADPQNKEAHYSLGVIAWAKAHPARLAARRQIGMRPEDPGPIPVTAVRLELKNQNGRTIDDGISNLEQALRLDPNYDDAMAYLNLLFRERADLQDTQAEYQQDIVAAEHWVQNALATKKLNAQDHWFSRSSNGAPQRIRVGSDWAAENLVYKVPPIYPALAKQARIQGTVHFTAIIGKDGRIENLQMISGHPLLAASAQEAARQWIYKPALLNGAPVEVVTQLDVHFTLNPTIGQ